MDGASRILPYAPNILGKYRLIAELGHGGMAEVFLAVVSGPAGFNKLVVVKRIRPQLAEDPEFLGMFLDEARLAARLAHPNVVQTNEVGHEGERYFIAMEYLEGQPLNRVLHRLHRTNGGLAVALHVHVIAEVLAGLHHAHELTDYDGNPLEVVHRDVTPHNIFVTYDGLVKVVDFGIAKALNSSAETQTGVLKGKVAYMAPEQARGERVDRRADIFSVGVLLWEAATGRRLWKGMPDIAILQELLTGEIPSPRTLSPEIPPAFEAVIMKALARDREDRFATAAELGAALEALLDEWGQRVSARDLGKVVAEAFEADRSRLRALVDEQLRERPPATRSEVPYFDPMTSGTSLPKIGDRPSYEPRSASEPAPMMTPSRPSQHVPGQLLTSSMTAAGVALPPTTGTPRRALLAVSALLVGALLAVGFWFATRRPATSDAAAVEPASLVTAKPVVLPPSPIATSEPTSAPLETAQAHVTPAPVASTVATPSERPKSADARPSPRTSTTTTPVDDDMKRPIARPKRPIDTTNPYANR